MQINEAVQKAIEENKVMYRSGIVGMFEKPEEQVLCMVKPTNSYEACLLLYMDGSERKGVRCWNPTVDDLTAKDWEVMALE